MSSSYVPRPGWSHCALVIGARPVDGARLVLLDAEPVGVVRPHRGSQGHFRWIAWGALRREGYARTLAEGLDRVREAILRAEAQNPRMQPGGRGSAPGTAP